MLRNDAILCDLGALCVRYSLAEGLPQLLHFLSALANLTSRRKIDTLCNVFPGL